MTMIVSNKNYCEKLKNEINDNIKVSTTTNELY